MESADATPDGPVQFQRGEGREGQVQVMPRSFGDLGGGQGLPLERSKDRSLYGIVEPGAHASGVDPLRIGALGDGASGSCLLGGVGRVLVQRRVALLRTSA